MAAARESRGFRIPMRLIIIGVIALIVVAGGGFAVVTFLLGGGEKTAAVEDVAEAEPEPVDTSESADLEAVVVPVMRDGRVTKYVALDIKLAVPHEAAAAVEQRLPHLRDAFLGEFYEGPPLTDVKDAQQLHEAAQRLLAVARAMEGASQILDVTVERTIRKRVKNEPVAPKKKSSSHH